MKSKASLTQRALLVGLLAGSGILAASAYATADREPVAKPGCEARQAMKADGKWEGRHAARMTTLKEKLKLEPSQQAAWDAFAESSQPARLHAGAGRDAMRAEADKLTTPQRLERMEAMAEMRHARMTQRIAATRAFYAQLSAEQQQVFDAEAMTGRDHGHRHLRHRS